MLVGLIVTLSGFCSLAYQVVWDRTLRYYFGGDSVSSAIVTGTFLLGLGIGALVFGKWRERPFTINALNEIGIGAYAIVSFYILSSLATMLGNLFHYTIADVEGLRSIVIVACILFLLPPCILMGGTLPLIFNCFVRPGLYDNRRVGFLYGLNTAGASFGILAVIFLFLNRIGLPATLQLVGGGNILLGVGVWFYGRSIMASTDRLEPPEAHPVQPGTGAAPAYRLNIPGERRGRIFGGHAVSVCWLCPAGHTRRAAATLWLGSAGRRSARHAATEKGLGPRIRRGWHGTRVAQRPGHSTSRHCR